MKEAQGGMQSSARQLSWRSAGTRELALSAWNLMWMSNRTELEYPEALCNA